MKPENQIIHIYDFRRSVLNIRFRAHIQHLLPDHKYVLFDSQASVFWLRRQISGKICEKRQMSNSYKTYHEELGHNFSKIPVSSLYCHSIFTSYAPMGLFSISAISSSALFFARSKTPFSMAFSFISFFNSF